MVKQRKKGNLAIIVKTETQEEFFARGKHIADLLDQGKNIVGRKTISFEDPQDLIKFLTKASLELLAAIRQRPSSITQLAQQLHRSRSSVDKTTQMLESIGIIKSEYIANPGHGKCRIVKAIDPQPIKLQVETFI